MDHVKANQHGNWLVRAVSETGSTNADLLAEGAAGAPDRSVLRADFQTAGRGRMDRTWEAPAGANLLVSYLFRPPVHDPLPRTPWSYTRAVALAALDVARERWGVTASLKWPNDILVAGVKAGGILAQAGPAVANDGSANDGSAHDGSSARPAFVVVGLGLNLRWAPPGATSLSAHSTVAGTDAHGFCLAMLPFIDRHLSGTDLEVFADYVAHVSTIGANVRVELPDGGTVTGRATSIEPDGRLVVLDDCAITHRFDTGDIIHLRTDGA